MKGFFISILLCFYSLSLSGQTMYSTTLINTNMMPGKRPWARVRTFPIFKTEQDSLECLAVTLAIAAIDDPLVKGTPEIMERRDSLLKRSTYLLTQRTNGNRNVCYPNPKFYAYDSLLKTREFSSVKQVSIFNLKHIPEEILQCSNLERLELVNMSIHKIPKKLNVLSHLTTIDIYDNRIKRPLGLGKNTAVKKLTIQYCKPKSLPRQFRNIKNLESLQLTHNELSKFVNGASHNSKLRQLDLSDNVIALNNRIAPHKNLKNLVLTRNNITRIPASINNLKTLGGLTLAYNSITTVSPEIGKLQKLEQLSFYRNQLPSIPSGVFNLTRLKALDLYYNQIETIPDSITSLKNLYILYLAFNKIITVTDKLGELTNLRQVYLHNNRISSLPESFSNLHQVEILRVNDNYLTQLPASISNLTLLQNLDIARNNFRSLNIDLNTFSKLDFLDISENPWINNVEFAAQLKKLEDRGAIVRNFVTGEYPDIRKND